LLHGDGDARVDISLDILADKGDAAAARPVTST
jgi:hypothetical protein